MGIKEKPLLRTGDKQFATLDLDFLNNKIYNGFLFDFYKQTALAAHMAYKKFPDFKREVGGKVSEEILFRKLIQSLFNESHANIYFDDSKNAGYPDGYVRNGNKIFLFECKDNLFPGKLVESYSFEKIKADIDGKFVLSTEGKKKGVTQLIAQLEVIASGGFDFDRLQNVDKVIVYSVIIHMNFTYRLAGVNDYLSRIFQERYRKQLNCKMKVFDLTMIDMETLFDMLYLKQVNVTIFEGFLKRYHHIVQERQKRLKRVVNDDIFLRSRPSFEEIYNTAIEKDLPRRERSGIFKYINDTFGLDEKITHAF